MAIRGVNKTELTRLLDIQSQTGEVFNETDTYVIDGLFFKYVAGSNSMEQIEPLGQFPFEFDPSQGAAQAQGFTPPFVNFNRFTGWVRYKDDEYTEASPWTPTANQWNDVPNNAGVTDGDEFPEDLAAGYYDPVTKKISGPANDGVAIVTEIAVKPTTGSGLWLDTAFFIGDGGGPLADGRIWQGTFAFPKGAGEVRIHNHTTVVFASDFVAANGGIFQVKPNNNMEIWGMTYQFFRIHKAR